MKLSLNSYIDRIEDTCPIRVEGEVNKVVGTVIEGNGPAMPVGGVCEIIPPNSPEPIAAEVIGFRDQSLLLMPSMIHGNLKIIHLLCDQTIKNENGEDSSISKFDNIKKFADYMRLMLELSMEHMEKKYNII